jgi:hypothetical protein
VKPLFMLSVIVASVAVCAQSPPMIPDFKVTEQSLTEAHLNYPFIVFDGPYREYDTLRREVIANRHSPSPAHCITTSPLWEYKRPTPRDLWGCFPSTRLTSPSTQTPFKGGVRDSDFKVTEQSLTEARSNYPRIIGAYGGGYETVRLIALAERSQPSRAYVYRSAACKVRFHPKPVACGELVSASEVIHVETY